MYKPEFSNSSGYKGNNQQNSRTQNSYIQNPEFDFNGLKASKYRDKDGYIREELISVDAKKIAEFFDSERKLSTSQVRSFYGEVKGLESRISDIGDEDNFRNIYPFILMLSAKAEYKLNKNSITHSFRKFIEVNVEIIKSENKEGRGAQSLKDFSIFFETVVGYFKGINR